MPLESLYPWSLAHYEVLPVFLGFLHDSKGRDKVHAKLKIFTPEEH